MIFKYASYALAVALVGALAYGKLQNHRAALLSAENASLSRSIVALTMQKEQAALARQVEAARADRMAAETARLNAKIETIFRGIPDATLDPALADLINGLQQNN